MFLYRKNFRSCFKNFYTFFIYCSDLDPKVLATYFFILQALKKFKKLIKKQILNLLYSQDVPF